ncbi:MAG: hemolysin family protein [Actinomycetota bacterium]|nr:HlyC/CorC family transporter [Acidimicrobiia bacterium]MDQ3468384.1 hemolysin family protein [Actinomycetota bacterium]
MEFTSSDGLMLGIILLLLILLAMLAVAETGINRIGLHKAEAIAHNEPRVGRALVQLVEEPAKFLNPVLLTVNILQTASAFLSTILLDRLFGPWGLAIGFVLNVGILFVFTEAVPKTWAVLHSEQAAKVTARPTLWLVRFWPLRLLTRALIGFANVILPGKGLKAGPFVSERELLGIVEAAANDDVIEHEERALIESIIEFGDTVAREVMVPRPDMVIVPDDATVTGALDLAIAHGYSRLPLHAEDGGDVLGLLYTKDLIRAERDGNGDMPASDLVRPVRFIPENKPVARLMREMQAGKFHLAIVADEYGGIAGLITLEDCLEELVGEIVDEYDIEELPVQRLPSGEYLIEGGLPVDELNELLDIEVPNEEWDSVGGFLFGTLEHVPEPGESIDHQGWRFAAEEIDGRRIRLIRVSSAPVTPPAQPQHDPSNVEPSPVEHRADRLA